MKVNITKADEKAIIDALPVLRLAAKHGSVSKHSGQKIINGLKKILLKHEERKAKSY